MKKFIATAKVEIKSYLEARKIMRAARQGKKITTDKNGVYHISNPRKTEKV